MPREVIYTTMVATKITEKTNNQLIKKLKKDKISKYRYLRNLIERDLDDEHLFVYNLKDSTITEDRTMEIEINKKESEDFIKNINICKGDKHGK